MRPWFRKRRAGIGYTPISWQGWLAFALLLTVILYAGLTYGRTVTGVGLAIAAGAAYILTILLTRAGPGDGFDD